jgi:hypothetical protein
MAAIGPDKIQLCVCMWGWGGGGDQGQADGPGAVIPHTAKKTQRLDLKKREV